MNYSHSSNLSAHIHLLNIKNQDFSSVRVDYKADYKWVNHNRFIFCITKTERVEEAQGIFSGYDAGEYEALIETVYLFSNPANAAHINESMKQAERGEFVEVEY